MVDLKTGVALKISFHLFNIFVVTIRMELTNFLKDLYQKGNVTVTGKLQPFETRDLLESAIILQQVYDREALEMPYTAPKLLPDVALWAAQYLYRATELTLRRDVEASEIQKYLSLYQDDTYASVIFSVDLVLRYLPDLWNFAKGLAPEDPLVAQLKATATQFPFSSVGMPIDKDANHEFIWMHLSLKQAYLDRIIEKKDRNRVKQFQLAEKVKEVLGMYQEDFWTNSTVL